MVIASCIKKIPVLLFFVISIPLFSQDSAQLAFLVDSINKSFTFVNTGEVNLSNNVSTLKITDGYKFLDKEQSRFVIEQLWGNPPDETIDGMLFPNQYSPLDSNCWAYVISYSQMGYIKDNDAGKIDYDDLLKGMQKEAEDANEARMAEGYEDIHIIGWASPPYYDNDNKALHWAKEIRFGEGELGNTLNYDVRFLGRKGVLSFNAVGNINQVDEVKKSIPVLLAAASFTEGNKYKNFDPGMDDVAAVGIGGLIAGKVLAKVGILAFLAKFAKVIFFGAIAFGGAIWKFITGRRRREEEMILATEPSLDAGLNSDEFPDTGFEDTEKDKVV
jgi:uncharacterized membrane-anchored protein